MPAARAASQRIPAMSNGELRQYCQTLRDQLHAKRNKSARLNDDLRRQENILRQAERELKGRSGSTGYRRE